MANGELSCQTLSVCAKNTYTEFSALTNTSPKLMPDNFHVLFFFYIDDKLQSTIFWIICLGSHKFLQTTSSSFVSLLLCFFCFILCNVLIVTPSLSINLRHKVSNFHFPHVSSTFSTLIKHDIREDIVL